MPPAAPKGRRRAAVPYNARVASDRQEKYYQRKRTFSKYRRFQRYEERQQTDDSTRHSGSLLDDAETLDAEYEKRLAFSFGGAEPSSSGVVVPQRAKRRRNQEAAISTVEDAETSGSAGGARSRKKKNRIGENSEDQLPVEIVNGEGVRTDKWRIPKASVASPAQQGSEAIAELKKPAPKVASAAQSGRGKAKDRPVGGRYSKDLKQYQQAQDAKEAERQRREDEIRDRNRKRKDHGKDRALKGQLVAQRTARGQPRMQSMLEAITSKLMGAGQVAGRK